MLRITANLSVYSSLTWKSYQDMRGCFIHSKALGEGRSMSAEELGAATDKIVFINESIFGLIYNIIYLR